MPYLKRMKFSFTAQRGGNSYLIRAASANEIAVGEHKIATSAILGGAQMVLDWPPRRVEDLRPEHLAAALELKPEVILLGTGARQHFPDPEVLAPAYNAGVGIEIMDTPAACRTYNILLEEGRRVVAALILEG